MASTDIDAPQSAMANLSALTDRQIRRFEACEADIRKAGSMLYTALAIIHKERLYRHLYSTFEAYVEDRLGISRRRAYQMLEHGRVLEVLGADTPVATSGECVHISENDQLGEIVEKPLENEPESRADDSGDVACVHTDMSVERLSERVTRALAGLSPEDQRAVFVLASEDGTKHPNAADILQARADLGFSDGHGDDVPTIEITPAVERALDGLSDPLRQQVLDHVLAAADKLTANAVREARDEIELADIVPDLRPQFRKLNPTAEQIKAFGRFSEDTQYDLLESVLDNVQTLDQAIQTGEVPEPSVHDVMKAVNTKIESCCRQLTKHFKESCPDDPWLADLGRKQSAERQLRNLCSTLRSAKCEHICPGCDGVGCERCHTTGRVPHAQYQQMT